MRTREEVAVLLGPAAKLLRQIAATQLSKRAKRTHDLLLTPPSFDFYLDGLDTKRCSSICFAISSEIVWRITINRPSSLSLTVVAMIYSLASSKYELNPLATLRSPTKRKHGIPLR